MTTTLDSRSPSAARPGPGPSPRRLLAATALAWAALAGILFVWTGRFSLAAVERACGAPAPDVRTVPSGSDVRAFLAACGSDGLAAYRDLQVVDVLYPAVNAALLMLVLGLLIRRLDVSLTWLLALPVVAAVGDYLENTAAWTMLEHGSVPSSWADALFPVGSAMKVGATTSAWLTVAGLLAWVVVRGVRARAAGRAAPAQQVEPRT